MWSTFFKDQDFVQIMQKALPYLALILLSIGILGFNHVLEIRAEEGRRAIVTYEMMQNDNLLVPYQYGHLYYNKPPFYNWVIAASFATFGTINEAALRFPGTLSVLVTSFLIFFFGKHYMKKEVALLSAGIYLTMGDMLFYGSVNAGEIDLFYSMLIVAQIGFIFYFFQRKQWLWLFVVSYLLTAIGMLTKGLPSLAFQGLTLLSYFAYKREFKRLFFWQHFLSIALMLAICSAYFLAYANHGDAIGYAVNIFKQASQRSANESSFLKTISQLAEFPPMFFSKLMPWSLALLFLIFKPIRMAFLKNEWVLFLSIFIVANIPVYWTAPDLRIRYTYMFFPVLAVLFAHLLSLKLDFKPKLDRGFGLFFVSTFILVGIALAVLGTMNLGLGISSHFYLGMGAILFGIIVWRMLKQQRTISFFWWIILGLALLRLEYNLVGMPYTKNQVHDFRAMLTKIVETADGVPFHYYDQLEVLEPSLSLFGKDFYKAEIKMPPDQTSSFAYYYDLYTGKVADVQPNLESGHYYVLFDSDFNDRLIPLDTFENMIGGSTMLFCKAK